MDEYLLELLRGTSIVLSHSLTMFVLTREESRIRHPERFWLILSAVLELSVFLLLAPFGMIPSISSVMFLIFLVAYSVALPYVSAGPVLRSLFMFLIYATYFMLSASIADLVSRMFFDGSAFAMIMVRTMISFIFALLLAWKLRDAFYKATDGIEKGWGILVVFSGIALFSVSWMSFAMYFSGNNRQHIILLTVFFVLVSASLAVIVKMIGLMGEQNELNLLRRQQQLLERELEAENEFIDASRRYRHDTRHHLAVLREYAEEGDLEALKEYLNDTDEGIEASSLPVWCENKVVNSLIRMNARRCALAGIRYSVQTAIPQDVSLSGMELGVIFGNLLENAVNAASDVPEPLIRFTAEVRNGSLFAEIRNTMQGSLSWQGDLPVSGRKTGGIGLKSVRYTVADHDGIFKCFQNGGEFVVQVMIPL